MNASSQSFNLELNGVNMEVQELDITGFTAYRVLFSSSRAPIVIARAKEMQGDHFWTSIPEGRQKEAEGVGKLIESYFRNKEQ